MKGLVHNKIMLALLGTVISISGFLAWKYNQEQQEKKLAAQIASCKQDLDIASKNIKNSKSLYTFYYARSLGLNNVNQQLERPGINVNFEEGKTYILIYNTPASLIPESPRYEGKFFKTLSEKTVKYNPSPLMVVAKSLNSQSKQAIVTSSCSPQPFNVSVENLYEVSQKNDFTIPSSPFSSF